MCLDDFYDGYCDWKPVLDANVLDRRGDDGDFERGLEDQWKDTIASDEEKKRMRMF